VAETRYLTVDDAISVAMQAMISTGEVPQGLRDRGLLESAVMRPRFLAHYLGADLFLQAAALGLGLSRSQALVDGNKRAGAACLVLFLRMNGYVVTAMAPALAIEILRLAEDQTIDADEADQQFADWLRVHTMPS
jgi:death on curing protein